jgi:hypothetical protein
VALVRKLHLVVSVALMALVMLSLRSMSRPCSRHTLRAIIHTLCRAHDYSAGLVCLLLYRGWDGARIGWIGHTQGRE